MRIDQKHHIDIDIARQKLTLFKDDKPLRSYFISSSSKGVGEQKNSFKTPRGAHIIRAKIGANAPMNTVFSSRRPTGETYSPTLRAENPKRDWVLTRIMWLSGLEKGKNRLGDCDTMQRYIYIHGSPDTAEMGKPGSHGCIRMYNKDLVELFDLTPAFTKVTIKE